MTTPRRTLIVTANPEPGSLTASVAQRLHDALPAGSVEIADLHAEGFDPRFTLDDRDVYHRRAAAPADVLAEQRRVEGATDLVLVFPVYWWSVPALLKGWIDRVLVQGWAFDEGADGLVPHLDWLTTHLVPIAGSDAGLYDRHGYETAIRTQLEHGVVEYCGSIRGVTAFLHDSEQDAGAVAARVDEIVEAVTARIAGDAGR